MEILPGCESVDLSDVQLTLSWNTRLSKTRVSTLESVDFSATRTNRLHSLQDLLSTVQTLELKIYSYNDIEREEIAGEGETYLVEKCTVNKEVVAVKHLKIGSAAADDSKFLRRLNSVMLELRIMHHPPLQNHPNILTLLAYGWNTQQNSVLPYVIVEYSPLGNLREYIRNRNVVTMLEREMLIGDVASGLRALHLSKIVHGDVKLENVLVFPCWDRPCDCIAKISDFGHSLLLDSIKTTSNIVYWGSPLYNAPETFSQSTLPIDREQLHKCDIWSFGLLCWELLIDGEYYRNHLSKFYGVPYTDHSDGTFDYQNLLHLALDSIRGSSNDLQRAFMKNLFRMTLQVDPCSRISDLSTLAIMKRWKATGSTNLEAALAIHAGTSEWSYEIFRADRGTAILWEHQVQIFNDFERCCKMFSQKNRLSSSAAWQVAMCYSTGFGVPKDALKAADYMGKAEALGHTVAKLFTPLILGPLSATNPDQLYTNTIIRSFEVDGLPDSAHVISVQEYGGLQQVQKGAKASLRSWIKRTVADSKPSFRRCNVTISTPSMITMSILDCAILARDPAFVTSISKKCNVNEFRLGEPHLIQACLTRSLPVVQALLDGGADPNLCTTDGCTFFHWIFMLGKDCTHLRFLRRPSPSSLNLPCTRIRQLHGQWPLQLVGTPLTFAIATGSVATVSALLQLGANPLAPAYAAEQYPNDHRRDWTPIHVAVKYHSTAILNVIIKSLTHFPKHSTPFACALSFSSPLERLAMHGPNADQMVSKVLNCLGGIQCLEQCSTLGLTPLMQAMDCQDILVLSVILKSHPELANKKFCDPQDEHGYCYPVHYAAQLAARCDGSDSLDILKCVYQYDHKCLLARDSNGRTPLHLAVTGISLRAAEWLLQQMPALLSLQDSMGREALQYCDNASPTRFLLDQGCNINHTDNAGISALHRACLSGRSHIVRALLQYDPDINLKNNGYGTPLHCAILKGSYEIVKMLLQFHPSIDEPDRFIDTPLNVAAQHTRPRIVKLLLEAGADASLSNIQGKTPLRSAVELEDLSVVKALLFDYRTIFVPDVSGKTPFQYCVELGKADFVARMITCLQKDIDFSSHLTKRTLDDNISSALQHTFRSAKDSTVCQKASRTLLHTLAIFSYSAMARPLLEAGFPVDAKDYHGCTALHVLLDKYQRVEEMIFGDDSVELFAMLLGYRASLVIADSTAVTPWDLLKRAENRKFMFRAIETSLPENYPSVSCGSRILVLDFLLSLEGHRDVQFLSALFRADALARLGLSLGGHTMLAAAALRKDDNSFKFWWGIGRRFRVTVEELLSLIVDWPDSRSAFSQEWRPDAPAGPDFRDERLWWTQKPDARDSLVISCTKRAYKEILSADSMSSTEPIIQERIPLRWREFTPRY